MPRFFCLLALAAALTVSLQPAISFGEESPAERDARMEWWRDAKFGMFIHWGVYAVPAGTYQGKQVDGIGEWIMQRARIPSAEYKAFARQFNPVKYNPEAWAELAKNAGVKYIVITSKHHDGFALYDSAVTDWDVVDATPYGKDLLTPLASAARRRGLKFGLYYSQAQDWNHPGGAKSGFDEGDGWDAAQKGSFDDYLRTIAVPQVREILTRFQPDVLWWDTPQWMNAERAKPLHALIALRPGLITNNRLGGGYEGDTETPEQFIPSTGFKGRDWETCMTMNDTWGFKSYDQNWKSTATLIHNLVDVVSKGGNYLLNVGPTAEGEIPGPSVARLTQVGRWMKVNGDAIYGTTASPCAKPAWGRITRKGDRLFLHVFNWPVAGRLLLPLTAQTAGCRLLADAAREFAVSTSESGLTIELTGEAPDPICSVVELKIVDEPRAIVPHVDQAADGSLRLTAEQAEVQGEAQVETIDGQANIGYWTRSQDWLLWHCRLTQPGRFRLVADVAAVDESRLTIEAGEKAVAAVVSSTGDYHKFSQQSLGEIEIPAAGEAVVAVRPDQKAWQAINLRTLTLQPAL